MGDAMINLNARNKFTLKEIEKLLDTAEQTKNLFEILHEIKIDLRIIRVMLEQNTGLPQG
jgi:hypothetical protein